MKKILRIGMAGAAAVSAAAVLSQTCQSARASTYTLNSTQDGTISTYNTGGGGPSGSYTEGNTNLGAIGSFKGINSHYIGIFDFNVHSLTPTDGGLGQYLTSNGIGLTSTAITTAIGNGSLVVQLGIAQSGTSASAFNGGLGDQATVKTIDAATSWTEGNGTNTGFTNEYNFTGTGATSVNPNQTAGPMDGNPSTTDSAGAANYGWGTGGNQSFQNAAAVTASGTGALNFAGVASNGYALATLNAAGVVDLLTNSQNYGLYLADASASISDTGGVIDYRESGAGTAPELIFTVVPEPASLSMFGLGGLLLLRRRRRALA